MYSGVGQKFWSNLSADEIKELPEFAELEKIKKTLEKTMNFSSKFFEPVLFLTSQIYKALVLLRLQCYNNGWLKTHQPETPVISVGNLTVGGTGKTPVVDFLVKEIQNQKKRPAILSRGYKRKNGSILQRFCYCEDSIIDPDIILPTKIPF